MSSTYSAFPSSTIPINGARVLVPATSGNLATIQTESGVMAIPLGTILAIQGPTLNTKVKIDEPTKAFRFRVANVKSKEVNIDVKYLTYGITWNPSYLITLPPTDDKSSPLTFSAKGTYSQFIDSSSCNFKRR